MKFSELIESERVKRGLNKAQMAILLGMSERMYDYYKDGKYDGQPSRLKKYLDKLSENKPESLLHDGKALQLYLKQKHGMISEVAEKMGFTTPVYMYELFEMQEIPNKTWEKFEKLAEIPKAEVIEKYKAFNNIEGGRTPAVVKETANKPVPVYDMEFTAGDVTQFEDFPEKVIGHIDLNGFRKCIAFVKIRGNSMFPTFTAGDLVGLEPQEDFSIIEFGQPFAIVTTSGQSLVKIIRKGADKDHLILRSNNKDFDDIDIHKDDILRLYKAHGPVRDSHY